MALPGNAASSAAVIADFVRPYDRYAGPLEDFEAGGIALNDSSQGLDYQIWHLFYESDEASPNYGDFVLRAETTGDTSVVLNVPGVTRVGLAFNQNMDPFICYETRDCQAKFYWYDSLIAGYTTSTLPSGSYSVACCLDDHRVTQTGTSDIILAYIGAGGLHYRQERDRFTVERLLGSVGAAILDKVGMSKNGRLKFEVFEGTGVRLSHIVGELCGLVGMRADQMEISSLYPIIVRGYKAAGDYSVADTLRSLQATRFWDFPEIDRKLVAELRGGDVVATISQSGCVEGRDWDLETAREQGVEFPLKHHLAYAPAETDYTPTKATSERRSADIKSRAESTINTAENFEKDDAAKVADKQHKIVWNEFEGKARFSLPDNHAELVPSNLIMLEVRSGVYKRVRITRMIAVDGGIDCEAVIDRGSAYGSDATAPATVTPETPPPTITGDTTWEFMDLPALITAHDGLNLYLAGHGETGTAWHGAKVQREVGSDWETLGDITAAETMGQVEEVLPGASQHFIDTAHTLLVSLNGTPGIYTSDLLFKGKGAWLVGNEIIQVRDWTAEGDNWRGSYLLRGRLDSTSTPHSVGERVVFLGNPAPVLLDSSLVDTTLTLRAVSYGQDGSDATEADYPYAGLSSEEWPPASLTAAQDGNDWDLAWVPRYRLGNSANPIPSANFYGWRLRFTVGATTATKTLSGITPSYTYTDAEQTADFGSAQSSFDEVEIRALNLLGGEGKALREAVS